MDDITKSQITDLLTEAITALAPDVNLRPMYGGTVIELIQDDPKSRVGGFFVYAEYVSLELANGVSFEDPHDVLEGSGKKRRHLKIRHLDQFERCDAFLRQAIKTN